MIGMGLPLHANISRTFSPSINSAGTRFVNGTWDFITTPYLYGGLQKNALSMVYVGPTTQTNTEGYNIGFGLPGLPIIPVYFAFSVKNNKRDSLERELSQPDPQKRDRVDKAIETSNSRINAIAGVRLPVINLGVYVQSNQQRDKRTRVEDDLVIERLRTSITSRSDLELYETKYGIEVGYGEEKLKWAWTFSLDYRDFDQSFNNPESGAFNDAPIFDFYINDISGTGSGVNSNNLVNNAVEANMGDLGQGFSRKEIGLNALGWYSDSNIKGNIGLDFAGYLIPEVSGRNSASGEREVSLTGYKVQPTLFYDYDIALKDDGSTLRLNPALSFMHHSEKADIAPAVAGANVDYPEAFAIEMKETELQIILGLKLVYSVVPTIQLFFSYLPAFTLYHLREESLVSGGEGDSLSNLSAEDRTNRIQYAFFSYDLNDVNLGMSYQPSDSLSMNFQVYIDPNSGEFDLTRFRVGLDFLFD